MMRPALSLFCLAVLVLPGCSAYVWSGSLDGERTPRTISLDTVENRVWPPREGLEYDLTHRLKDEIAIDRRFKLVSEPAEIVLEVSLLSFDEPVAVESFDTGAKSEVVLRAEAAVRARGSGVEGGSISRKVSASASWSPLLGDSREEALHRLWRDLAREILDAAGDREWASSAGPDDGEKSP